MISSFSAVRLALAASILLPTIASAQSASPFKDLPTNHSAYEAVIYLKGKGILQGYEDGTFRPNQAVNRAEAVKILVAPLISPEELAKFTAASVFSDVATDAWYKSYVEAARTKLRIIDGPPAKSTFRGSAPIQKAEFLKMLELSQGVDPVAAYGDMRQPLATDVANANDWYFPYMRYAIASSMTMISQEGLLLPAKELTRSEVAVLLYRFLMFKQGARTQALLSEAESEVINVLQQLQVDTLPHAEYASARASLAAKGALASKPNEAVVKGAVKITEGFATLVQAYKAGIGGQLDEVIRLAGETWQLGEKAKEFDANLTTLAAQMQAIAKSMADEARSLQSQ
jgi:hypothetical protein